MLLFLSVACLNDLARMPPEEKEKRVSEPEEIQEAANIAPEIQIAEFSQTRPVATEKLQVEAKAHDADGDFVRLDYEWSVNDQKLPSEGRSFLPPVWFKKNDRVHVKVIAMDGKTQVSTELDIRIQNSAPTWIKDPRGVKQIDGYQAKASDPDEDPLVYSIDGAPDGMSIDPNTGVLRYKGTMNAKPGTYDITVLASDPDGAFAKWAFSISVQGGSQSSSP